ncbi:GNAT family N-acetyltransferase [Anaerosoma tenue]|uniref:GNAT family N-acetyltransferase n=1 Tax=Anaerosoma tenue TaxID=2933588 RepID=UPI002260CD01|nr:GNAT family N-acetyltransferase [Anaerosoma tenue]MCK8115495.1 N-acetyltransferase family protein [Anaerosoma tenue]
MLIRDATIADAGAIASIYSRAVLTTTASFDVEPVSAEDRERWLKARSPVHPVLVCEADGVVAGWGALSPYSERRAYAATVELSVYVDEAFRKRGIGRSITAALIERAESAQIHVLLARICTENTPSIEMVRALDFAYVGTMHEVGRKFDRWLDVATWEYIVCTPDAS